MPLNSTFYHQNEVEVGNIPMFSGGLFLEKDNFSAGLAFQNIQSLFMEDSYILQNYIFNPTTFRLYVSWTFLD